MKRERVGPTGNRCYVCRTPLRQPKRGRLRRTCSDKCRQAWYRRMHGVLSHEVRRGKRLAELRRSKPFIERRFDSVVEPVMELSHRRWYYECKACGKGFIVDQGLGGRPSAYCSEACRQKVDRAWDTYRDVLARGHQWGNQIDKRGWERLKWDKLSPLSRKCRKPCAPNTPLFGKPGASANVCSDQCRKRAIETRWMRASWQAIS